MTELPTLPAGPDLLDTAVPLLDLRAPAEVAKGALVNAASLPLLTDAERHEVGVRYQAAGQAAAIALGETLVAGAVRAARVQQWLDFAVAHPGATLFCWRGGLRSAFVQRWLADAGTVLPRVAGGYKALRQVALQTLQDAAGHPRQVLVLGGPTGSGKTALLREFAAAIDLEDLAKHRGSAFGGRTEPQPTQTTFENSLAHALLAQWRNDHAATLYEDESHLIGRTVLPEALFLRLKRSALVIVDVPLEERALHIRLEYVDEPLAHLIQAGAADPHEALAARLTASLGRVQRRLGGQRHDLVLHDLAAAFADHAQTGDPTAHRHWIEALLEHYYDPMYAYQQRNHGRSVTFRGDPRAVQDYLAAAVAPR